MASRRGHGSLDLTGWTGGNFDNRGSCINYQSESEVLRLRTSHCENKAQKKCRTFLVNLPRHSVLQGEYGSSVPVFWRISTDTLYALCTPFSVHSL